MKKLIISILIILLLVTGGVLAFQRLGSSKQETEYQFSMLERGSIENLVSSTGTLSAVGTVEVGSQVSGTVEKVLADYNDEVKKGQVLAIVDTSLLTASVNEAEANLAKTKAQFEQAQTEYQRNEKLFKEGYISEITFLANKTDVATNAAAVKSAEVAVKRAKTNLKYAEIRSPISGRVIERSIDAGQTIAASMSAPTLFTIAEDLSHMQIEAAVDESDIGKIKDGMSVRFTVQAYDDETFTGTVRQIRLQPKTVENVVTYTVVVDALNEKGLLLPGMTATVDFIVEERQDVLTVPNTALSFQPTQELFAALRQQQATGAQGDNGRPPAPPNGMQPPAEGMPGNNASSDFSRVFYLDDTGKIGMARFKPGITDGTVTEVSESRELREGLRVITGTATVEKKSANSNTNALSSLMSGKRGANAGGPPGGPPPF
ncbi:efflux transporter, RND family, MFP subunit [Candidatus Moduliflexus flocculans]|uniref:Efflux transporter, RND family, MFP subunit n=1 Tax=Candidatus Moduliflexus flocculans TaxID=1499966 RepID=A0A0S6VX21_9BACT|nr:efflux transporter, RND family, MFP subunit [Candidatus Moduliflexus flocculans]